MVRRRTLRYGSGSKETRFRQDADFKVMDAISCKYTGNRFPFRNPAGRVAIVIEVVAEKYTKLPFEHTPPR